MIGFKLFLATLKNARKARKIKNPTTNIVKKAVVKNQ
jgi:hypothetical protein